MKSLMFCLFFAVASAAPSRRPQFQRGSNKIVGGTDAELGEIPYQISLQDLAYSHASHICGGTIYNRMVIITAGHCVDGQGFFDDPYLLRIVAGQVNLNEYVESSQIIDVVKIVRHEFYNSWTLENDIALLKLATPLTFNDYVHPIALPSQGQPSYGDALISGWGSLGEDDKHTPATLQKVTIPIVSDDDCRRAYSEYEVTDSMICAGVPEGGIDACYGDSGGPMVCTSDESPYLCGLVSWGIGCARPGKPGVYTEVSYYVDWIHEHSQF